MMVIVVFLATFNQLATIDIRITRAKRHANIWDSKRSIAWRTL